MATPIQVIKVSRGARTAGIFGGLMRLRSIFLISIMFAVVATIFANGIIQSIQQHSFAPFFNEIINRLLLATNSLNDSCLKIISNGGTYDPAGWFGNDIWEFIESVWPVFVDFFVVILWIRFFAFLVKKSPLSNESNWFINYSMAVIIFIVLEMFGIIIYDALAGNINSLGDAFHSLGVPIVAFIHFFQSLGYIFSPLSDIASKYYNKLNDINQSANITNNITSS